MKTMFKSNITVRRFDVAAARVFVARGLLLALIATALLHSTTAHAQVFNSIRGLLTTHFQHSQRVTFVRVQPSGTARTSLEQRLGTRLAKNEYVFYVATTNGHVDGYALVDQERGEHELIDFAVFFDVHGAVTHVEVLAYREPYGDGIRSDRFRRQFVGRTARSGFRAGDDIDSVSGATISTRSMCAGVQRASMLLDTFVLPRPELAARAAR